MQKKTKEQLQAEASLLYKEGHKKLFATEDGYFFTDPENVKVHAKNIESEIFEFLPDGKIEDTEGGKNEEHPIDPVIDPDFEIENTRSDVRKPIQDPEHGVGDVIDPEPSQIPDPEPEIITGQKKASGKSKQ